MNTILLTGAAGIVGKALRPLLAERYGHVLLTDVVELQDLAENESFERGDVADLVFVTKLASQVDGIVHLAGMVGADYTFQEVLAPNITGTYNIYAAATAAGVSHVVYASSHHAVGFFKRGDDVDDSTAPRPDTIYGLSKAFGESSGSYFADKFGLNVLVIRIGSFSASVIDERRLHIWVSAKDLAQLIEIGLGTPTLGYEVVYGVSEVPAAFFDNSNAVRLGYRPKDRAMDHLADPAIPSLETADSFVGGPFAKAGQVKS